MKEKFLCVMAEYDEPKVIQEAIPYIAENFSGFVGKIKYISLYEFWPSRFITREVLL